MTNIILVGAGKMGGAMLRSWVREKQYTITILDPGHTPAIEEAVSLGAKHVTEAAELPVDQDVIILAVKPQLFKIVAASLAPHVSEKALIVSILAGTDLENLESVFPTNPIIRSMPNTPASIGKGITAITGNALTTVEHMSLAQSLLSACGHVRSVETETLIDVVTAISGSGPAYIFHFVEALSAAGEELGLSPEDAQAFARHMVIGAGALLDASNEEATQLRKNVTSPNGTTQAALDILMGDKGLGSLLQKTTKAAFDRAQELAKE